jgi:hypothetical protein
MVTDFIVVRKFSAPEARVIVAEQQAGALARTAEGDLLARNPFVVI